MEERTVGGANLAHEAMHMMEERTVRGAHIGTPSCNSICQTMHPHHAALIRLNKAAYIYNNKTYININIRVVGKTHCQLTHLVSSPSDASIICMIIYIPN
jgi:hypothetical protein